MHTLDNITDNIEINNHYDKQQLKPHQAGQYISSNEHIENIVPTGGRDQTSQQRPNSGT